MLKQGLYQKLLQKLSPQQIQLMKLLQLPTIALEQRIKEELETNPALEEGLEDTDDLTTDQAEEENNDIEETTTEDDYSESDTSEKDEFLMEDYMDEDDSDSYKLKVNNSSSDDEQREAPLTVSIDLHELLERQLGMQDLNDQQYQIALFLIGSLDDDGYLRRDLASITDDIAFSHNITTNEKELEDILHIIQSFDPPGVAARDLQECLLLQLKRKDDRYVEIALAINVVKNHMDEFSKKHYDKIQKKLDLSDEQLKEAIEEIVKLDPKPGNSTGDTTREIQEIIPDFMLYNNDGTLELSLNSRNQPELKINKEYMQMLNEYSKSKDKSIKEASGFVKQKIENAKGFIDAIKQRENTLMGVMQVILEYQYEYFQEGDETKLKPMILKDIADKTGLDISTISRVSNSKYIQTTFGTFPLKSFFSESMATESGEEVSSKEVKKILQENIEAENKRKPLTDDALTALLKEKGYTIARRTVAKYRENLGIPVARMRKEL